MTTWPERQTASIGAQVRRRRRWLDMTQADLSARCGELELPISRAKIANLENGRARQEGISVAELHVLARALDVPPILLLFDDGRVDGVEVLPGVVVPTWRATEWFTGEESRR